MRWEPAGRPIRRHATEKRRGREGGQRGGWFAGKGQLFSPKSGHSCWWRLVASRSYGSNDNSPVAIEAAGGDTHRAGAGGFNIQKKLDEEFNTYYNNIKNNSPTYIYK